MTRFFRSIRFVLTLAFVVSLLLPLAAILSFGHVFASGNVTDQADMFWLPYREIARPVVNADVHQFYLSSVGVVLFAVILAFMLALFLSGQIIVPVLDLRRSAREFASGQPLPARPPQTPFYELSDLARTFYEMARELEAQREQKEVLLKKLINAQEEERKLIAYDLHDGLIQQLVGARLYFSILRDEPDLLQESGGLDKIKQACDALSQAITEGRRIIQGLHPTILDDLGVVDAIAEMARQMANLRGWTLQLELDAGAQPPDRTVGVMVFRAAQEALNNISKHANADNVTIRLRSDDQLCLTITDDGDGFDPAALNGQSGFGLKTMQERMGLLNGTCKIYSSPGAGTTVEITTPLLVSNGIFPSSSLENHP